MFTAIQESENKFCLCLLDSDLKFPSSSLGDTAKAVQSVDDPQKVLCKWAALSVRTIENLVPSTIYKEIYFKDVNKKQSVLLLNRLVAENHDCPKYMHLRKPLKLIKVFKEHDRHPFHIYWFEFANCYRKSECISECLTHRACPQSNEKECQCFVTLGFGEKIMSSVEKEYSDKDISDFVDAWLKPEWTRIGELITFWCLSSQRIISISS